MNPAPVLVPVPVLSVQFRRRTGTISHQPASHYCMYDEVGVNCAYGVNIDEMDSETERRGTSGS
jgi:hypothetical protein